MNSSKARHDKIQQEIAQFPDKSSSMIDFFVHKSVSTGVTSIDELAKKLRLSKDAIISNVSSRLFKVTGDSIQLVGDSN